MSVLSGVLFIFCVHIWIRLLLFLFSVQIWLLSVFFFLWPIFHVCRSQMRELSRSQQLRQDSSANLLSVFLLLRCCFRSADEPRPVLLTSLNGFFPGYSWDCGSSSSNREKSFRFPRWSISRLVTSEKSSRFVCFFFLVVFEIVRRIFFLRSWEIAFLELFILQNRRQSKLVRISEAFGRV
jgi:hypothetical protein